MYCSFSCAVKVLDKNLHYTYIFNLVHVLTYITSYVDMYIVS